jgi:phosphoglycerate dehydrogenase-like enzyme
MSRPVKIFSEPVKIFNEIAQATERLRDEFPSVEVIDITSGVPADATAAVMFGGWGANSVEAVQRGVQWVQLSGTGINNIRPEILEVPTVTCARGASAIPISEYVIGTMLAFGRGFPQHWLHDAPKHWNFQRMTTLAGSTLGLVGLGGIGERIATLALAFDMRVTAMRRTNTPSPVRGVEIVTRLDDLLEVADHLVLAAPATDHTQHLMNDAAFAKVKPGLHLVNIARGSLVDQDALRVALDDGRVARASLDVCEPEPLPAGHWMFEHPKVFLTPHSSWSSTAFFDAAIDIFCTNLAHYIAGEPLEHLIDRDEGY